MTYLFSYPFVQHALTILIALVWLINGLFCKIINLVPRHQLIVENILGNNHAFLLTKLIGLSETAMTIWILSGIQPRFCAATQIAVVAVMNIIEFIKVPHLLLFGRINILVAVLFILIVYINAYVLPSFFSA